MAEVYNLASNCGGTVPEASNGEAIDYVRKHLYEFTPTICLPSLFMGFALQHSTF